MPTEEVFTSPDARRTEGTIRSTLPLVSRPDRRGLELTFEAGRAVRVEAETGAELVRSHFATIENADRLGEVALVTRESRVGQTGRSSTTRSSTRTRPATSRTARLPFLLDGEPDDGLNVANMHVDFMVGGPSSRWTRCSPTDRGAADPERGVAAGMTPGPAARALRRARGARRARTCSRARRSSSTRSWSTPSSGARSSAGVRAGASYVHVLYRDDHIRHAMIELGPDSALTYSPEWLKS
jgi:hypothetical protein